MWRNDFKEVKNLGVDTTNSCVGNLVEKFEPFFSFLSLVMLIYVNLSKTL